MKSSLGLLAAVATLLLWLSDASAFNCSRANDDTGPGLYWSEREVVFTFFDGGTADLPGEEEFDAVRDSFVVWEDLITDVGDACDSPSATTDFTWQEDPIRSNVDRIGYNYIDQTNNENLIIFRDDEWPYPGQAQTVIALSTTTFNSVTGELLDADIEFNSANFQFTTRDVNPITDLMNAAVHEIGHSMGLAHSPDPSASMFLQASPGQISKRTINCDDRDAIIFKYPSGLPNRYCDGTVSQDCGFCAPPNSLTTTAVVEQTAQGSEVGGCSCGAGVALPWWIALGVFGVLRRVRRTVRGS